MSDLIEIYIHEVTKRVPEKNRKDIALELRSTIADMLPENYQDEDIHNALEKLGNPVLLASGYREHPMQLIGPRYYDVYLTLLKMIIPISIGISFIVQFSMYFIDFTGDETVSTIITTLIGTFISTAFELSIQLFFWLTIIFAIVERIDREKHIPFTMTLKKWTPDELKFTPHIPKRKKISHLDVFASLLWTAIWATLYFNADHFIGIFEDGRLNLEFRIPAFNQELLSHYVVIVIIIIALEVIFNIVKLIKGQWTNGLILYSALLEIVTSIIFIILLSNPKLLNEDFTMYIANYFDISAQQIEFWFIGGAIFIIIVFSILHLFDCYRKLRAK